jgi:hypothetical protein
MDGMEADLREMEGMLSTAEDQSDVPGAKASLAQLNGNLDKLQATKIDAIVTAELKSGHADAKT